MNYFEFKDLHISEICLGTMMFGSRCNEKESIDIIHYALDQGINFFDVAESYNKGLSEEILGNALIHQREKSIIVTKGHISESESLTTKVEQSLKRLKTDYIDFYLIHWPKEHMNVFKIMEELNNIVQSGKVRYIGCSNYPLWLFAYSNSLASENNFQKFSLWQLPYNLVERGIEVEILPYVNIRNPILLTYRPLVMGFLSGKYNPESEFPQDSRGSTDERVRDLLKKYGSGLLKFLNFAKSRNIHPVHLAIAWVRYHKNVTAPIVGVSSLQQLQSAIKGIELQLTEEEYHLVTSFFNTEVQEESLGKYKSLRRSIDFL